MKENSINIGKMIRIGKILSVIKPYTLFVDLSFISTTGPFPAFRNYKGIVSSLADLADVLIINLGQIERNPSLFIGKDKPRLIIRLDWTNAFRDENYPLSTNKIQHVTISDSFSSICSGADGVIVTHLLGYGDEVEINSFKNLNKTLRDSWSQGLPVFVQVYPFGPLVTGDHFNRAMEMGVSMGTESGADAVFIPEAESKTYENIKKFCSVPFFIWCENPNINTDDLLKNIKYGANGFVFGKEFFIKGNLIEYLKKLKENQNV